MILEVGVNEWITFQGIFLIKHQVRLECDLFNEELNRLLIALTLVDSLLTDHEVEEGKLVKSYR